MGGMWPGVCSEPSGDCQGDPDLPRLRATPVGSRPCLQAKQLLGQTVSHGKTLAAKNWKNTRLAALPSLNLLFHQICCIY